MITDNTVLYTVHLQYNVFNTVGRQLSPKCEISYKSAFLCVVYMAHLLVLGN